MPDFSIENVYKKKGLVAGLDEAGRGPLAGPVVAAAVIFPWQLILPELAEKLDDSKKLSPRKREKLFDLLYSSGAIIGVGMATAAEIDEMNILQATFLAMRRAMADMPALASWALVDGNRAPALYCPCTPVVKGDGLSLSIAAASIIAKVTRDNIMDRLALQYPEYGWDKNAAYGTKDHLAAIEKYGVTPEHRKTFAPMKKLKIKS